MRARSPKRAAQENTYRRRRQAFLEANPYCARCYRMASEVHHMRGRVGADLLREEWWLPLCHPCHAHVTEHPHAAVEQGFSLPRLGGAA